MRTPVFSAVQEKEKERQWRISQSHATDLETQFYKLVGILHSALVHSYFMLTKCKSFTTGVI